MNKYDFLVENIKQKGIANSKFFGNSMSPIIKSGENCTIKQEEKYDIDNIVFCKVKGNYYLHKIVAIDINKGYLIGNNKGRINGWTKNVYGRYIGKV